MGIFMLEVGLTFQVMSKPYFMYLLETMDEPWTVNRSEVMDCFRMGTYRIPSRSLMRMNVCFVF